MLRVPNSTEQADSPRAGWFALDALSLLGNEFPIALASELL